MCGRYTLTTVHGRLLAERFELGEEPEPATLGRFNVCPTEPIAIATAPEQGEGVGEPRVMRTVRWGLVPPWAREVGKGFEPINARSETVADKQPFADLYARPERRCLVLADGWYEWLRSERPRGERVPFRYTVDGGEPFAFAGVWGRRRLGDELVASATILTTRANGVCAPVHDRMPCVLAGPDEEAAWLAGADDPELLVPCADARVTAAPANPAVNRAGVEGPELLDVPVPQPPAQQQLSL
jgi:putative SOS response-associated peptidase YedK